MKTRVETRNDVAIAVIETDEVILYSPETALSTFAKVRKETGADRIVLPEAALSKDLFSMAAMYAFEAQRMVGGLQVKIAVVGEFEGMSPNNLRQFNYEKNPDASLFIADSEEQALERLSQ